MNGAEDEGTGVDSIVYAPDTLVSTPDCQFPGQLARIRDARRGASLAKVVACPKCDARGDVADQMTFEVRGVWKGRPVRKCRRCGSGMLIRILGRPKLIPPFEWAYMERTWFHEFGLEPQPVGSAPQIAIYEEATSGLVLRGYLPYTEKLVQALRDHRRTLGLPPEDQVSAWSVPDMDATSIIRLLEGCYGPTFAAKDVALRGVVLGLLPLRRFRIEVKSASS